MNQKKLEIAIIIGIAFNIILTLMKLIIGYMGHSEALITDGFNSLSDVVMSLLIYFVLKVSSKKPDQDHPYGHQKFEGIAYFALGMIFLMTSILLFVSTTESLITFIRNQSNANTPTVFTLYTSIVALVIKLFLAVFYYKLYTASKHPTLKAESHNHALDMLATSFTLIGIVLARLGFIIFDYIAAIVIVFLILRLSVTTLKEAISYLTDQAPEQSYIDKMFEFISNCEGVIKIDDLKIRMHMTNVYVDVEIAVEANMSLNLAHKIAENVHDKVEDQFPKVIHCMVHVNPNE